MNTVKLDCGKIKEAIEHGDRFDGGYVLAVDPEGSKAEIHWMQQNRQWDPWPKGWLTIGIPSLDPEGTGQASEDAEGMLKCVLSPEEFEAASARCDSGEIGWVDLAEELAPEDWRVNREESVLWLADAFLAACNGNGTDLGDPQPWGYDYDEGGYPCIPINPPASFEWA